MDKMMGKSEKEKKSDRINKILKKRKQRGIESFLDSDKYMPKNEHLDRQMEELAKIKKSGDGINNNRAIRNKNKRRDEKIRKDIDGGMFGVPKTFCPT